MIDNFQVARRGGQFRVSLQYNGRWGHGVGETVKKAKAAAKENALSQMMDRGPLVWRADEVQPR